MNELTCGLHVGGMLVSAIVSMRILLLEDPRRVQKKSFSFSIVPVFVVDAEDCPRNVYIESVRDAYLGLNFVLLKLYL